MRIPIAAALLLSGCAATDDSRFVLLESESYGCGAAEGFGCGLAIAPVLQRMDELPGVEESSVSWDGRFFRIQILPGADPARVAAEAGALLEGEECCVTASRGKADPGPPDSWFDEEGTVALSRHEAEVIARHYSAAFAEEVALEPREAERLHVVLLEELVRAFERAHAAGGGAERLWDQLALTRPRFEARIAEFLTPEQSARVAAVVARELGE